MFIFDFHALKLAKYIILIAMTCGSNRDVPLTACPLNSNAIGCAACFQSDSYVWLGWLGARRQLLSRRVPDRTATAGVCVRLAGVRSSGLTTWPHSEMLIILAMFGRTLVSVILLFWTKLCQRAFLEFDSVNESGVLQVWL